MYVIEAKSFLRTIVPQKLAYFATFLPIGRLYSFISTIRYSLDFHKSTHHVGPRPLFLLTVYYIQYLIQRYRLCNDNINNVNMYTFRIMNINKINIIDIKIYTGWLMCRQWICSTWLGLMLNTLRVPLIACLLRMTDCWYIWLFLWTIVGLYWNVRLQSEITTHRSCQYLSQTFLWHSKYLKVSYNKIIC